MGQESDSLREDVGGAAPINLFWPYIPKDLWITGLSELFNDRWVGQGPAVDQFEALFCKQFQYGGALALNSGTAALELAYDLVGIGSGDIVLTPVLTCTATNIPLLRRGAVVKFVDVDRTSLTMDVQDFVKKMRHGVKAVVVTTLGGLYCDRRIYEEAQKWNVPIIVDAAQSLGVRQPWGDYICYSFQAIKHFTTGDGGMLVCANAADHWRAKRLRWFGIDREVKRDANWQTWTDRHMTIDIAEPGYKMHMNDIAATLGIVSIPHTNKLLAYRKRLLEIYAKKLGDLVPLIYGGSLWLLAILVDSEDGSKRAELAKALKEECIDTDMVHLRNDIYSIFGGKKQNLPNMNWVEPRYLYLPLHQNLQEDNIERVCSCVSKFLQQ